MAYYEPRISYAVQVDDSSKQKQPVSIAAALPLLSVSMASRAQDYLDLIWAIPAKPVVVPDSKELSWDVAVEANLVKIDEVDYKMAKRALNNFKKQAQDMVSIVHKGDRVEVFNKQLLELTQRHFADKTSFDSQGFHLYFANGPDAVHPVFAQVRGDTATFWFFKDILVQQ